MHWFQTLDTALFHCVNPALKNPFFDVLMPFLSGNKFFAPALLLLAVGMLWKGGARGRICLLMLCVILPLGDNLVINYLKELIQRPRPFLTLTDVQVPPGIGLTHSGSMPSGHSANWFCAATIAFIYFRRTVYFMFPMALLVAFSRLYDGVHYPGDIAVGAILGFGYGAAGVWTLDQFWQKIGKRWFPIWWQQMPSLLNPVVRPAALADEANRGLADQQWLHLAYALIAIEVVIHYIYNASGVISLSEDEAYQWVWSKHLALSYYSKPLLIALAHFADTWLWGDTVFGVRFLPPLLAAITSIAMIRFVAKVANARAAFWLSIVMPLTPLLAVGSTLMTIDPLSVMFWTFAMIAGWRAVSENSRLADWCWVGLWMGLGFLSKYTSLFQLLSWVVVFALIPKSRKQLLTTGPWLALLINLICALPVLIWNHQHGWITIKHVSEGGRFDEPWQFTLLNLWRGFTHFTLEFVGEEVGLQNPCFFLPLMWALLVFWRRKAGNHELKKYLFSMGAPIFMVYLLLTFHSRALPNWIAPSIIPFFCLGVIFWEERWRAGFHGIKYWLLTGIAIGGLTVVVLHNTKLIPKFTGWSVPPKLDSTRRVKGWVETAQVVEAAREKLLAEGQPVFIIGGHYGITGELTFNLPEARAGLPDHPLVYYQTSPTPDNQFYFWPGYEQRKGQNAIYVQELEFTGTNTYSPPRLVQEEFESITNGRAVMVIADDQPVRRLQIMECRGLK